MNPSNIITLDQLEALASELEGDRAAQHERLARLCRAYGRILRAREPERFEAVPRHYGDEAGSWDNSYPPKKEYSETTGPRCVRLRKRQVEDIATERGFYYAYRTVTTYGGLYIGLDGRWYRGEMTGTGRYDSFAAHPGCCDVDCTIEWSAVSDDDLTLEELADAEAQLRALAFPLAATASAV